MKLLHKQASHGGAFVVTVHKDSEWSEYRVRLWVAGSKRASCDYPTADKADAFETAGVMLSDAPKYHAYALPDLVLL